MKKGLKWKLIALLTLVASVFVFAGCKLNDTKEDILDRYNLTVSVTYYANGDGASFGTAASEEEKTEGTSSEESAESETPKAPVKTKTLWYQSGSVPLNIGVVVPTSGSATVAWNGHQFKGWYHVVRDDTGKIVYEADGTMKLGEAVDFSKPLEQGKNLEFCADWRRLPVVNVLLAETDGVLETTATKLTSFDFNQNKVAEPTNRVYEVNAQAYTVLEYYTNETLTEKLAWPISEPMEDDAEDVTVYAKCLKGTWTLLKTANDVKTLFAQAGQATKSFYLYNDIDCEGMSVEPMWNFKAKFQGNGKTISNFKVTSASALGGETSTAMFGDIYSSAKIENVTFKNVTVEYTTAKANMYVYLVFTNLLEENGQTATITDVNFEGITMTVTKPADAKILNIYKADTDHNDRSNWLYGSETGKLDSEFELDIEFTTDPTFTITNN